MLARELSVFHLQVDLTSCFQAPAPYRGQHEMSNRVIYGANG